MSEVIVRSKNDVVRTYKSVDFHLEPTFFSYWIRSRTNRLVWLYVGGRLYCYDSSRIVSAVCTSIGLFESWKGRYRPWSKSQDRDDQIQLELPFGSQTTDAGGDRI